MKINQLFFFILFILFSQPSFANCARGGGIFADKSISTSTIALPANVVVESRSYSAGDPLYDSGWKSGSDVAP